MLDLLYVAKLDYLAGLRRSSDNRHRPYERFVRVDRPQEVVSESQARSDLKPYGKFVPSEKSGVDQM